jgi:hypothetical protein
LLLSTHTITDIGWGEREISGTEPKSQQSANYYANRGDINGLRKEKPHVSGCFTPLIEEPKHEMPAVQGHVCGYLIRVALRRH